MPDRILVTGASGLVGAEVASVAAAAGYDTIGLGHTHHVAAAVGRMNLDLTAASALEALRSLQPLSAVAHCAAAVPPSLTGPAAERVARVNEQIDSCIVEFCRARGIRLVYCSTVSVYGEVAGAVVDETSPTNPIGPYAIEKLRAEGHVREKLPSYAILRICAPYGPTQRQQTVLRIFVERALAGEDLKYFGSGLRQQDFLHVHDAALAVLRAIEHRDVNGVFNVCGGAPISMRALAHLVLQETGSQRRATASGDQDPQEDYRARFDTGRVTGTLGWRPTITLAEGVRQMVGILRDAS
ncbi:MAG TPA: NAD-dependent epimerase/dehydratase family protein [Steroidobacteraceae bacterium]|nr:NAD-dependent epimerase/dehydratase family protein [Steroidobacteraceae bacterium]